jgi:hypothetical protein
MIGNIFGNTTTSGSGLAAQSPIGSQAFKDHMADAYQASLQGRQNPIMHGLFPDNVGTTVFDGRLIVTKVCNGYVVQYASSPNKTPDVYVEVDLDAVNARIRAIMTGFNLEKR